MVGRGGRRGGDGRRRNGRGGRGFVLRGRLELLRLRAYLLRGWRGVVGATLGVGLDGGRAKALFTLADCAEQAVVDVVLGGNVSFHLVGGV